MAYRILWWFPHPFGMYIPIMRPYRLAGRRTGADLMILEAAFARQELLRCFRRQLIAWLVSLLMLLVPMRLCTSRQ